MWKRYWVYSCLALSRIILFLKCGYCKAGHQNIRLAGTWTPLYGLRKTKFLESLRKTKNDRVEQKPLSNGEMARSEDLMHGDPCYLSVPFAVLLSIVPTLLLCATLWSVLHSLYTVRALAATRLWPT